MRQHPATALLRLWTIGHSTRSSEDFVALLCAHSIERLIDIRRYAGSRRYPHFHAEALAKELSKAGLSYEGMPTICRRKSLRRHSTN